MYFSKTILILEDNLRVLSKLLEKLYTLEGDQPWELSVMIFTNSQQVENYLNSNPKADFDIALVDFDDKTGGSFHDLEVERFGPEKVIAISSVPERNKQLQKRGVNKVVLKDYQYLDVFAEDVAKELGKMIRELP